MCLFGACDAARFFRQLVLVKYEDWDEGTEEERMEYVNVASPIFGSRDSSWWRFLCWQRWRNLLVRQEHEHLHSQDECDLPDQQVEGFLQVRMQRLRRFHLLPSPLEQIYLALGHLCGGIVRRERYERAREELVRMEIFRAEILRLCGNKVAAG